MAERTKALGLDGVSRKEINILSKYRIFNTLLPICGKNILTNITATLDIVPISIPWKPPKRSKPYCI